MRTLEQKKMSLQGFAEVKRNLQQAVALIENKSMAGLIEAVNFIHRKTETEEPMVPVDTGNLRHSWFTSTLYKSGQPSIMFGFSANYALWVHEMLDADFNSPRVRYRNGKQIQYTPRQGAGSKFLETHLKRNHNEILSIIRNNAKI